MKLIADHITYEYPGNGSEIRKALDDINLVIDEGEFIAIIGKTGSGKSTLVQHLNGLLKPTSGTIYFDGEDVFEKGYDRKKLRSKVGLVFQYPEHQLFAETIYDDVTFGPLNLGLSKNEAQLRAYEALKISGISEELFYQSPFDLSGGQKRRVALAGVLAMKPEILVLDEPTAGLDPKGRDEMLDSLKSLQKDQGITIVLVSHSMEDVARYADRIVVLTNGKIRLNGTPHQVFENKVLLEEMGLQAPQVSYLMDDLKAAGLNIDSNAITLEEAKNSILAMLK